MSETPGPETAGEHRERLGRLFHEAGRVSVNAERKNPYGVLPWGQRTGEQREIDMRGAEAVAEAVRRETAAEIAGLRAKLAAIEAHCRRKADFVNLHCPDLGRPAEALVKVADILAITISEEGEDRG